MISAGVAARWIDGLAINGIDTGRMLTPVIDRRYSLSELPEAIRYSEEGHARGKIIVTME